MLLIELLLLLLVVVLISSRESARSVLSARPGAVIGWLNFLAGKGDAGTGPPILETGGWGGGCGYCCWKTAGCCCCCGWLPCPFDTRFVSLLETPFGIIFAGTMLPSGCSKTFARFLTQTLAKTSSELWELGTSPLPHESMLLVMDADGGIEGVGEVTEVVENSEVRE